MPKRIIYTLLLVSMLALVACSADSDDSETAADDPTATAAGTPTAAEQAYLDEVENAAGLLLENFARFGEVMAGVFATRGALFGALEEAGAGTAFDSGLAAMEALEPPERFRDEHELALDGLREFQRLDRQVGQAVADVDLVAFALANVQLSELSAESPLQHSETFCLARFIDTPHLCERPDFSSSGGYGESVYSIVSRIETDVGPALFGSELPALSDEEALEVLAAIAPGAIDALEQIERDVRALDPPAEFVADHDILVEYLGDFLGIATERRQAAERGDLEAVRAQIPLLIELFCGTANELSPTITPFLVVHFGVPIPCGVE